MGGAHFAQRIKDVVEVGQDFTLRHLGDIVHAFAGIIADSGILICEAGQNRRHNFIQVPRKLLSFPLAKPSDYVQTSRTGPNAMAAAANPISPPFLA